MAEQVVLQLRPADAVAAESRKVTREIAAAAAERRAASLPPPPVGP
jgi:hypothetical protein